MSDPRHAGMVFDGVEVVSEPGFRSKGVVFIIQLSCHWSQRFVPLPVFDKRSLLVPIQLMICSHLSDSIKQSVSFCHISKVPSSVFARERLHVLDYFGTRSNDGLYGSGRHWGFHFSGSLLASGCSILIFDLIRPPIHFTASRAARLKY